MFVLSGEDLTIQRAEIAALVDAYVWPSRHVIEDLGQRVVVTELGDMEIISKIADRAAYCRFGGQFISSGSNLADLLVDFPPQLVPHEKTFAVASETLPKSTCGDLGAMIKQRTAAKVSLEKPDVIFEVDHTESQEYALGVSCSGFKSFSWRNRRPRARRFFLPSAIYPKLARLLVNLSRVREGQYFLDPFCGTGSLLIEASLVGAQVVGIDITRWIARGAQLNMKGFALGYEGILRADSTYRNLPFAMVHAISTDVPYGRAASTKGKSTDRILREFIAAASEVLSNRSRNTVQEARPRYCVIMHPSQIELDFDKSLFAVQERHHIYVHRTLTRAITVLRSLR